MIYGSFQLVPDILTTNLNVYKGYKGPPKSQNCPSYNERPPAQRPRVPT